MKKKSGKSGEPAALAEPLVRGPRSSKAKGNLAELAFLHKASSLGFGVAKPYGDDEHYDFILDSGERLWRVQVKSTSYAEADRSGYVINAWHNCKGRNVTNYKTEEVDFLAAYLVPLKIWYIIPANQLASLRSLRLYPAGCKWGGCFERFREAWYLMAPGADLPQPRVLRHVPAPSRHRKRFVE